MKTPRRVADLRSSVFQCDCGHLFIGDTEDPQCVKCRKKAQRCALKRRKLQINSDNEIWARAHKVAQARGVSVGVVCNEILHANLPH